MLNCIPTFFKLAYSGEFIKCEPSKKSCLVGTVLTVYGQVFQRERNFQNWTEIKTPNKFWFRTKDNHVFKVNKLRCKIIPDCLEGEVFVINEQVLYEVKNNCWIPKKIFDQAEKICQCEVIPIADQTFEINVIGSDPKVLPSSQIPSTDVTFNNGTATIDVSNLPLNECVLLRYESTKDCQLICVDLFLIKCSQTDFCDPIPCKVDETCGGIFPCPPPTGDTINVPDNFPTIQSAVDASSSGDLILVGDGTYIENIIVNVDNLTIRSVNPQGATIQQPVAGADSIVQITSQCVTIDGFIIEGPFANNVTNMIGVEVTGGGSAQIINNLIRAIRRNPLTGDQQGHAISVNEGSALIQENTIEDYQKTGVWINLNSCGVILDNTITGVGPTNVIAQNGIAITRGATAVARMNQISGNSYTLQGFLSTDILLFETVGSNPVCVENNTTTEADIGIATSGSDGALIQENNSNNNLWGIVNYSDALANIYINNVLSDNTNFDIFDGSLGLFSAGTGNAYLCNDCLSDNRDGRICESTSPLEVPGPEILALPEPPQVSPP